ncbi:MAG: hypothetical protein ACRYFB_05875 [Janthinobacterium lividum]
MRTIACIFFVLLTLKSFGQVKEVYQVEPWFFLDSVRISKNQLYFDPDKIVAINVVKDKDKPNQKEGKIYLKSKNPKGYNFLTLKGIEKTYVKTVSGLALFMIDNLILKDNISTYKIDSAYILNVEILKSTEIEYLKKMRPLLTIISIKLKTKENVTKANEIRIRGTRYSLPNNLNK